MVFDEYTTLLLSAFLALVYGLQVLIVRIFTGRRGVGLSYWTASFLAFGAGYIISMFIDRMGSPLFLELLMVLTTLAGFILLQTGWSSYFYQGQGALYRIFCSIAAAGSGMLILMSDLDLYVIKGLLSIFMLGWTVVSVLRSYLKGHEASLLSNTVFSGLGLCPPSSLPCY